MRKTLLIAAVLFSTNLLLAQIPKPLKNTYVNDFAHVLTPDQITALNQQIFDIEKQSDVQFAVVLVSKLPDDMEVDDFSLLLARKWHVGKHKNGLVYVAAIKNHKQRIEVADSISSIFTGDKCTEILNTMKPSFKAGEYNAGLQTLVSSVRDALAVTVQPVPQPPITTAPAVEEPSAWVPIVGILIFFGFIGLIVLIAYRLKKTIFSRGNNIRYNSPNSNAGYYNNGYNNPPPGYYPHHSGSGLGSFIAGAATGYAARTIQDDYANNQQNDNYDSPPANDTSNSGNDNRPDNWGNWGSDSGSSSNDSSSSYDSGSSSSSNDDSGFSGSDSSGSGGGASSDW